MHMHNLQVMRSRWLRFSLSSMAFSSSVAMATVPPRPPVPIRFVALDMDGTALNERHELSHETLTVLRSLSERGIDVALCSGRSTAAIHDHIERLQLPRSVPIVAFNGAAGMLATTPGWALAASEIFKLPVAEDAVDTILAAAEERGEVVQYYVGTKIYVVCKHDEHVELTKRYAKLTGVEAHRYVKSYDEAKSMGLPYKCLVMTNEIDATLAHMQASLPTGFVTVIRGTPPFFIECLSPEVNKGKGLERLCRELKVPLGAVAAFGDGDNDVEFVTMAGLGVAMSNGRPPCIEAADRVTERDHAHDGVAHTLRQLEEEGLLWLPAPRAIPGEPTMRVRRVNPSAVVGVRESVLWPGQPEMCILPEDSAPSAIHLAALAEGSSDPRLNGGGKELPSSTVCGVLSLFLPEATGGVAKFRKLAVDPPFRRRGLATALVETAAAEARLAGATALACDARVSQCAFYEARGFLRNGEAFDKYPGKGAELYVRMRMDL